MKRILREIYFNYLWWIWQIILVVFCAFFLVVGIQMLIKCYQLNNPFYFMMIFFSSNLITEVSQLKLNAKKGIIF